LIYDEQTEGTLIGSIIRYPSFMDDVMSQLKTSDFYTDWAKTIFDACKELHETNRLNAHSLTGYLEVNNTIELVGGKAGLRNIYDAGTYPNTAKEYIGRLKLFSARRNLLEISDRLRDEAMGFEGQDASELMTKAYEVTSGLEAVEEKQMISIKDVWDDHIEKKKNRVIVRSPKIGIAPIDYWMNGIGRKRLIVVAGRPGTGKTALALQSAYHASTQGFGAVPYFSMEMDEDELIDRLAANISGMKFTRIRNEELTDDEFGKLNRAKKFITNSNMFFNTKPGVSFEYVAAHCRSLKRKHGSLGAVVIDYLGLMDFQERRGESMSIAIGRVTKALKNLSKELDCSIILLAQMNREIEKRSEKRPVMSDLRDSGSIEQDADMIIFLSKDEEKSDGRLDPIDFIVAKGRQTGTRDFELIFAKETQQIAEKAVFCK